MMKTFSTVAFFFVFFLSVLVSLVVFFFFFFCPCIVCISLVLLQNNCSISITDYCSTGCM